MKKANYNALLALTILVGTLILVPTAWAEEDIPAETQTASTTPMMEETPVVEVEEVEEDEGSADVEETPGIEIDAGDTEGVVVEALVLDTDTAELASTTAPIMLIETTTSSTPTTTDFMAVDMTSTTASTTITVEIQADPETRAVTGTFDNVILAEGITAPAAETASSSVSTTLATVDVRIHLETIEGQLIDETITVTECPVLPGSASTSLSAWCAVEQLAAREDWSVTPLVFGDALFVSAIDARDGSDFNFWAFFHNDTFASLALNQYLLQPDDDILLSYGVFPSRLTASDLTPTLGTTTTITAETFGFDSSFNAAWLPTTNVTFTVNGIDVLAPSGTLDLAVVSNTAYSITATPSGSFQTDTLTITPAPQTTATVQIETPSGTLFSVPISFSPCDNGSGTQTANAKCALDAVGVQQNWPVTYSQFGSQYFLQQVDTYATDFGNSRYWLWFHNQGFASEAVNEYIVSENDVLLFTYGVLPTRLTASTTMPTVSTTIAVLGEEFGFDENFNGVWAPATSASFTVNGIEQRAVSGTLQLDITTTTPYTISLTKQGFATSMLILTPSSTASSSTTTPETPCTSCSSGGGGQPTNTPPSEQQQVLDEAIAYIISQQQADGSFGSLLFSDWVAMAYGTYQSSDAAFTSSKALLIAYLTDSTTAPTMASLTDYERHVLGLRALGQSADIYRQAILNGFDGTQFGSMSFVNDDIFAILALHELGCCRTEMEAAAEYIVSKQNPLTGSIDGTDLTAAAIRALNIVYGPQHESITKAKQYLKTRQEQDGRIGGSIIDIDATTWALDAIGAVGETSLSSWFTATNETPLSYLLGEQSGDGSFGIQNKVWSTAYAVLALQHNWSPQRSAGNASSGGGVGTAANETTVTTSVDIVTTTDAIVDLQNTVTTTTDISTSTGGGLDDVDDAEPLRENVEEVTQDIGGVIDDIIEDVVVAPVRTATTLAAEDPIVVEEETQPILVPTHSAPIPEIADAPPPLQQAARGAAGTASAAAGGLLIFLAWRFVQALI